MTTNDPPLIGYHWFAHRMCGPLRGASYRNVSRNENGKIRYGLRTAVVLSGAASLHEHAIPRTDLKAVLYCISYRLQYILIFFFLSVPNVLSSAMFLYWKKKNYPRRRKLQTFIIIMYLHWNLRVSDIQVAETNVRYFVVKSNKRNLYVIPTLTSSQLMIACFIDILPFKFYFSTTNVFAQELSVVRKC